MAVLVPSLKAMFAELNRIWPNRDRRTDGWIGDSRHCPGESDHCADSSGRVHAIDIDKDGIDATWVVWRLRHYPGIVRYINYNRLQYHVRNDFAARPYTGSNPHTDHIHVSIEHTDRARAYVSGYGFQSTGVAKPPTVPNLPSPTSASYDSTGHIRNIGTSFVTAGDYINGYANGLKSIRS